MILNPLSALFLVVGVITGFIYRLALHEARQEMAGRVMIP